MRLATLAAATAFLVVGLAGCQAAGQQTVTYRVGNTKYSTLEDYLVALRRQEAVFVGQLAPSAQRLGGTALLILPSTDNIRRNMVRIKMANGVSLDDAMLGADEVFLASDGEAIRKGGIFDAVTISRADNPPAVPLGDTDYVLMLDRFGGPGKWTLVKRGGGARQLVLPQGKMGRVAWLNGLNIAVINAAAELGAPVTRQPLPSGFLASGVSPGMFGTPPHWGKSTGPLSGTAFFVDASGHAVTNAHVVPNCKSIKMNLGGGRTAAATIAAKDPLNDLALLSVDTVPANHARLKATLPRLGEDVVVYGFPYAGQLSTQGTLSTGIVSALAGPRDDSRLLQVSAPVQPGNSGGPLLDRRGEVVGVVSAKINALRVAALTGDIPQNINFAIKSSVIRDFLETNGLDDPAPGGGGKAMPVADVANRARSFTFMVTCER